MLDPSFLEEHERFIKAFLSSEEEMEQFKEIMDELIDFPGIETLGFGAVKDFVLAHLGEEKLAIAAYTILKAYFGDKILLTLIDGVVNS